MRVAHSTKFEAQGGQNLPLNSMAISATLCDALVIVEQVQMYRNSESINIEAVYSFPLPVEATLLHLAVSLNERQLLGCVTRRTTAEKQYEEAIASGDTAVMLETIEPGLYCLNVGNLMPDETAEVTLRYALPLRWEGRQLRMALPTTIAPRYGNQLEAGVQQQQAPTTDLLAEHSYSLALRIQGALSSASVSSPSHGIKVRQAINGLEVTFVEGQAYADRDLVIILQSSGAICSTMRVVPSAEGYAAHVAIVLPEKLATKRVKANFLVDCSGSMAGDSMALARAGTLHALAKLEVGDYFSVSAFGNVVQHAPLCAKSMLAAGVETNLASVGSFIQKLDASMGGTELLQALEAIFALNPITQEEATQASDVLLITDGETWDRKAIVDACRKSGHRIFVIGIGSSPAEALIRGVAEATGGAAAFVNPGEDIRPVVDRHFRRMRLARITAACLKLSGDSDWITPMHLSNRLFSGDTQHVFCSFKIEQKGPAGISITYEDGESIRLDLRMDTAEPDEHGDLTRIAASARIRETIFGSGDGSQNEMTDLALKHQIISPFTNYILVHQRGEESTNALPELRQIPTMLAAGWGGVGSIRVHGAPEIRYMRGQVASSKVLDADFGVAKASLRSSDGVRKQAMCQEPLGNLPVCSSPKALILALNPIFSLINPEKDLIRSIDELRHCRGILDPISDDVIVGLESLVKLGWSEQSVVVAFWVALMDLQMNSHFGRSHRRAILRAARTQGDVSKLAPWIRIALINSTDEKWRWEPLLSEPNPIVVAPGGRSIDLRKVK